MEAYVKPQLIVIQKRKSEESVLAGCKVVTNMGPVVQDMGCTMYFDFGFGNFCAYCATQASS